MQPEKEQLLLEAEAKRDRALIEFRSATEDFAKVCSYFNFELVKASAHRLLVASDQLNALKFQS